MSGINVQPVIMCGGAGTRLWPLSRAGFPKEFLARNGEESRFQQAAGQVAGGLGVAKPGASHHNEPG